MYGLNELLVNAVEHGNLGISYAEKTTLVLEGGLVDEIGRRLSLLENQEKWGYLSFETAEDELRVLIKDEGQGFDWRPYLELSPERTTHPHGRGIATSRLASFTAVEYAGCGNEVICTQTLASRGAANAGLASLRSPGSPDSANS